jgi:hypothetical protein
MQMLGKPLIIATQENSDWAQRHEAYVERLCELAQKDLVENDLPVAFFILDGGYVQALAPLENRPPHQCQ